ncbi:MAG: response regulator transcription factor [Synergistaceae bacterium]|nr:response regulator transcription factor [Synergistaceae bacterium]
MNKHKNPILKQIGKEFVLRVLLVEDNEKLGGILRQLLENNGSAADWAKDASEAYAYIDYHWENVYDVIVLDWMLPGQSGPEICAALRQSKRRRYDGGILFLTARDSLEDKIIGLEAGGDDYLVKPFENAEFIARLRALYRRKSKPYVDNVMNVAGVIVNRVEQTVYYKETEIRFSNREFEILDLLLINIGNLLPRNTIIDCVWGCESDVSSANLDAYIYILRKKIAPLRNVLRITSRKGVGYKIEENAN